MNATQPINLYEAEQSFVAVSLTRHEIAQELNAALDRDEFLNGDSRLTDELCRKFALAYGQLVDDMAADGDSDGVALNMLATTFATQAL